MPALWTSRRWEQHHWTLVIMEQGVFVVFSRVRFTNNAWHDSNEISHIVRLSYLLYATLVYVGLSIACPALSQSLSLAKTSRVFSRVLKAS